MLPTPLSGGGLWAQSYGTFNPLGGGATAIATGSDDVAASGGGVIVGVDRQIAPGLVAGVAAGYDRIRLGLDGLDQQGEIASHRVAVYGGRQVGGLRLGASAGYAYHLNRTERQITFAAIDRAAAAEYGGHELTLAGETGYRLALGDLAAEPVAGLAYTRLIEAGYEESGAGAVDLTVDGRTTQSLRSTLGLRLGLDETARVRPQASLAWGHEFATTERGANARFAGGGGSFTLDGAEAPRDLALVTIGIEADLAPGTLLAIGADGALGQDQTQGTLKAAIKLAW
jgi:subtilase-type serine protease